MSIVKASSPGKVLILGGYLIVEAPNVGISIGTTARFETRVASRQEADDGRCHVHILSPQFGKEFTFECTVDNTAEPSVSVTQTEGPSSPFLFYSVLYAVAAALLKGGNIRSVLTLELLADNDFYSQRNYLEAQGKEVSVANLRALPSHLHLVGSVSKTGLGSSAAMTTSVVACLYFSLCNSNSASATATEEVETVHRIAQVAHSVAQGKIGSGFDVYTATYGTCAYRRFPAHFIEKVIGGNESPKSVAVTALSDCFHLDKVWVERVPFQLPTGVKLVLGDVHQGGSGTPGMVSKVMAWRRSVSDNPDSLWHRLQKNNEKYVEALRSLIEKSSKEATLHQEAVNALKHVVLAQHTPKNDAERLWVEASACAAMSRRYLREMGQAANVEIEPKELGVLLDSTLALPGVFAVGCPGAGGYDAVFALVLGDATCAVVEAFWEGYSAMRVCPLLVREDAGGLTVV
ncbi:putative phosphomevalonate kinase protein [Trypanosoma grayi]|uniref:putative phosphomevalonate kinase protein n=1 Tax=Trypanosoma grayi TaxID=71804 RepID=UPI0004F4BB55|nr:putative phosphomevalonate kinase protein [Trypanosoma grayi]KEG13911.1 putative phosphomevalonate kinase protein [Trypanosoma grayi]